MKAAVKKEIAKQLKKHYRGPRSRADIVKSMKRMYRPPLSRDQLLERIRAAVN